VSAENRLGSIAGYSAALRDLVGLSDEEIVAELSPAAAALKELDEAGSSPA
jgi:hypothetical protein